MNADPETDPSPEKENPGSGDVPSPGTPSNLICEGCGEKITGEFYLIQEKILCSSCKAKVKEPKLNKALLKKAVIPLSVIVGSLAFLLVLFAVYKMMTRPPSGPGPSPVSMPPSGGAALPADFSQTPTPTETEVQNAASGVDTLTMTSTPVPSPTTIVNSPGFTPTLAITSTPLIQIFGLIPTSTPTSIPTVPPAGLNSPTPQGLTSP